MDCPECAGFGYNARSVARCCGGSDWECGAKGCTGPREDWEQEQCEYCLGSGEVEMSGEEAPAFDDAPLAVIEAGTGASACGRDPKDESANSSKIEGSPHDQ